MEGKFTIFFILCALMHLNTCIVDMPEDYAYGKYSFFYIFYRNPVF